MARVLRVDGSEERVPLGPYSGATLGRLRALVGAHTLSTHGLYDGRWLVCDDNGLSKRLPLNRAATDYYNTGRTDGGYNPVVGDVVICERGEVE